MAEVYLMNPTVVLSTTTPVNSFDVTDQVMGVTISDKYTELKKTTFGNTIHQTHRGLRNVSIQFDLYLDFSSPPGPNMFEIFQNLIDTENGEVDFDISTDEDAGCSGTMVVTEIPSFKGSVDQLTEHSLTFQVNSITYRGDATPLS